VSDASTASTFCAMPPSSASIAYHSCWSGAIRQCVLAARRGGRRGGASGRARSAAASTTPPGASRRPPRGRALAGGAHQQRPSTVDARALILARRCGRVGDAADQPASNDRAARAEPTALAAVTKPRHHPLQTHKYTATTWNYRPEGGVDWRGVCTSLEVHRYHSNSAVVDGQPDHHRS
jgi:hypothetical protein